MLTSAGISNYIPHLPKCWDTEAKAVTAQLNLLQKEFRLNSTEDNRRKFIESKKKWIVLKADKKIKYDRKTLRDLTKAPNGGTFWNIIKRANKRPQNKANEITGLSWELFYKKIYARNN